MCCYCSPCRGLYTNSNTLKSLLYFTGKQCNWDSTGVMCSHFLVAVSSLAAAMWNTSNLATVERDRPKHRELQWSSLDEIKAWITVSRFLWGKRGFKLAIFLKWKKLPFTSLLTCLLKGRISNIFNDSVEICRQGTKCTAVSHTSVYFTTCSVLILVL